MTWGNSSTNTWMPTAVPTNKRNALNSSNAPIASGIPSRGTSMATACKLKSRYSTWFLTLWRSSLVTYFLTKTKETFNTYIPYFHYIPRCQNYYNYYSVLNFNSISRVDVLLLLLPVCSPPKAILLHQLGPSLLEKKFLQQMSDSLFAKNLCLLYYEKWLFTYLLSKTKNHSPPLLLLLQYYNLLYVKWKNYKSGLWDKFFLHIKVTDSYYGENKLVFLFRKKIDLKTKNIEKISSKKRWTNLLLPRSAPSRNRHDNNSQLESKSKYKTLL